MGKDSLIKSTAKKKGAGKQAEAKEKQKNAKKPSKDGKKAAPATKQLPPKLTLKEILLKQFEWKSSEIVVKDHPPQRAAALSLSQETGDNMNADPKERAQIRALLSRAYDMEAIRAAAQQPQPTIVNDQIGPEGVQEHTAPPAGDSSIVTDAKPDTRTDKDTIEHTAEKPSEQAPVSQINSASAAQPLAEPISVPRKPVDDQPSPKIEYPVPGKPGSSDDPIKKSIRMLMAGAFVLVVIIIAASWLNSTHYYLVPQKNRVEIWRGRFSPLGKHLEIALPISYSGPVDPVYSRDGVYPLVFDYYLSQADALLKSEGLPDYEEIKVRLAQAAPFAVSSEMKRAVQNRLNNIDRLALLYKADVYMSTGPVEYLQTALTMLQQARELALTPADAELINLRINETNLRITAIKNNPAGKATKKEAAPQPETPAKKKVD